jgi:hypothetical protein
MTVTITAEEIESHRPDVLLPPDPEFAREYESLVRGGRAAAKNLRVAMVAICRNAMPWLPQTLALVEETGAMFKSWSAFVYENDSVDDTKGVLGEWHDGQQRHVSLNINGRPHLNTTVTRERTHALAEYRAECQQFVRNGEPVDYVIVFDSDAWSGWSVDGVATSIAHMEWDGSWYGLASYSWAELPIGGRPTPIHYDAWAARLNHWKPRDHNWFFHWHPAVGSPPVEFRSAFGQLAVYDAEYYLKGTYGGDDCEHVVLHKSISTSSGLWRFGLNPSSRCVSFWVPRDGQHIDS